MLNLTDDMRAALSAGRHDEALAKVQAEFRVRLSRTHRFPNSVAARLLLFIYLCFLLVGGGIARLFHRTRPDRLLVRLSNYYAAVPEMTLHKAIELRSLAKRAYVGNGLDLGCGDGIVGGMLIEEAGLTDLHGVDISPVEPESIMANGYVGYTVADIQRLPEHGDATFDYVVSICVIEHVPDLDAVVTQAARVLKPGGVFYFTTPSPSYHDGLFLPKLLRGVGLKERANDFNTFKDLQSCHHHYLSQNEWISLLKSHGFADVEVEPIFSRGQLMAYDLLNAQVYLSSFYFYPHLLRWVGRFSVLKKAVSWATAELCGWIANESANEANHTHFSIACRKT